MRVEDRCPCCDATLEKKPPTICPKCRLGIPLNAETIDQIPGSCKRGAIVQRANADDDPAYEGARRRREG